MTEFFLTALGIAATWAAAHWYFRRGSSETPAWAHRLANSFAPRPNEQPAQPLSLAGPSSADAAPHQDQEEGDDDEAVEDEEEGDEDDQLEECPRCHADALELEDDVVENAWGVEIDVERCPTCGWSRRVRF